MGRRQASGCGSGMSGEAYVHLASYYDRLMHEDYRGWAAYLLELALSFGERPQHILELGCGTGNITEQLVRLDLDVTGVDCSEAMLAVAAGKLAHWPSARLLHQDMAALDLSNTSFDAAICACDGFNYLLTDVDLERTLSGIHKVVRPGGLLLFDLNSAAKLQGVYGDNGYAELFDDFGYFWDNHWDEEQQQTEMTLTFFVPESAGLYRRLVERHTQRLWTPERVTGHLTAAGWELLGFYDFPSFDEPHPDTERWQFAARRT